MSKETEHLKLFEYDITADGDSFFSIDQAMNNNWDKLDENIGEPVLDSNNNIISVSQRINNNANSITSIQNSVNTINNNISDITSDINRIDNDLSNIASPTTLGRIRIGNGLNIDVDGVLSTAHDSDIDEDAVRRIAEDVVEDRVISGILPGQIITTVDPITTDNSLYSMVIPLDGQDITNQFYSDFFTNYIDKLIISNPERFKTEDEWDEIASEYNSCPYYVYYDSEDPKRLRVPKIRGLLSSVGNSTETMTTKASMSKDFGDIVKTKLLAIEDIDRDKILLDIKDSQVSNFEDIEKVFNNLEIVETYKIKDTTRNQQYYETQIETNKTNFDNSVLNLSTTDPAISETLSQLVNDKQQYITDYSTTYDSIYGSSGYVEQIHDIDRQISELDESDPNYQQNLDALTAARNNLEAEKFQAEQALLSIQHTDQDNNETLITLLKNNTAIITNSQESIDEYTRYVWAKNALDHFLESEESDFKYYGVSEILEPESTHVYYYLVIANAINNELKVNVNQFMEQVTALNSFIDQFVLDTENNSICLALPKDTLLQGGLYTKPEESNDTNITINFLSETPYGNNSYVIMINPYYTNQDFRYTIIDRAETYITIQTTAQAFYWLVFGTTRTSED